MPTTPTYAVDDLLSACIVAEDALSTLEAIRIQEWTDENMPRWIRLRDYITRCHKAGRPIRTKTVAKILGGSGHPWLSDLGYDDTPRAIRIRVWNGRGGRTEHITVDADELRGLRHALEALQDTPTVSARQIRDMGFTHTISALFIAAEMDPHRQTDDQVPPLVRSLEAR